MAKSCRTVRNLKGQQAADVFNKQDGKFRLIQWAANWCHACQETKVQVNLANQELCSSDFETVRIDTDADSDLADEHEIEDLPTVQLVRNGKVLASISGSGEKSEFVAMVEKAKKKIKGE